jgi:DNA repair exonuclease SbcCD ATPase subunit
MSHEDERMKLLVRGLKEAMRTNFAAQSEKFESKITELRNENQELRRRVSKLEQQQSGFSKHAQSLERKFGNLNVEKSHL